ncbi:MAG TPA: hypothetical protein VH643_23675 [Gemmataceae bacterium]
MDIVQQPDPQARQQLPPLSRLKVHLRLLQLGGSTYRLVTLRPATRVAFSTNYYHNTWHLLSDMPGSRLLARLLWGLAYQRQPNTMIVLHGRHLLPTPFEGERSDPFLLIPSHLTGVDSEVFRNLKNRLLHLGQPSLSVRWLTFGLDKALETWRQNGRQWKEHEWHRLRDKDQEQLWRQERMGRCGGFIYYTAPPAILRQQALTLHSLRVKVGSFTTQMDYHFLAQRSSRDSWSDGEVQIFADYRDRVSSAIEARKEILPYPNQPVLSETLQEVISRRRDQIKHRKRRARHHAIRSRGCLQ